MALNTIWAVAAQLMRSLSTPLDPAEFTLPPPLPQSSDQKDKALVLVNSGRLDDVDVPLGVARDAHRIIDGGKALDSVIQFDVAIRERTVQGSEFRSATVGYIRRNPTKFALALARHRSLGAALIAIYRHWLRENGIVSLELFSSNSRLIEAVRIAAVIEGLTIVEYLHGVSTDGFAIYYDFLEILAAKSGAELHYVNMLPGLPQPAAIERRLLRHDGHEAYFQNERRWKPRGPKMFDVLIVGSGAVDGNYAASNYFLSEQTIASECLAVGLDVVLCPHPLEFNQVAPLAPPGVVVGALPDYANSARVLVGHFSTALFTAHLQGYDVLLFPAAWPDVPENQRAIFPDRDAATLSLERLQSRVALAKEQGDPPPSMTVHGYALDNRPEGILEQ